MAEYYPVELGRNIIYSGYFSCGKLIKRIKEQLTSRGYSYYEQEHNEIITDKGKNLSLTYDIDKYVSDYEKLRLEINLSITEMKEKTIELNGKKIRINDGRVKVSFSSWVVTDYEGRYEGRGVLFYFRTLVEKFFFERRINKLKTLVSQDVKGIIKEIKSYLNLQQY